MGRPKGSKNKQKIQERHLAFIKHTYYCKQCWQHTERILSCHEQPPFSRTLPCDACGALELKYEGGTDCRVTTNGNCGYVSFEKGSEQNIKRIGQDAYEKMCNEDRVVAAKRKGLEEGKKCWWREGGKPLDLNSVKDVNKYIQTGDKN